MSGFHPLLEHLSFFLFFITLVFPRFHPPQVPKYIDFIRMHNSLSSLMILSTCLLLFMSILQKSIFFDQAISNQLRQRVSKVESNEWFNHAEL